MSIAHSRIHPQNPHRRVETTQLAHPSLFGELQGPVSPPKGKSTTSRRAPQLSAREEAPAPLTDQLLASTSFTTFTSRCPVPTRGEYHGMRAYTLPHCRLCSRCQRSTAASLCPRGAQSCCCWGLPTSSSLCVTSWVLAEDPRHPPPTQACPCQRRWVHKHQCTLSVPPVAAPCDITGPLWQPPSPGVCVPSP